MPLSRLRPIAFAFVVALALAWAFTSLSRPDYVIDSSGARPVAPSRLLYLPLAGLAGLALGAAVVWRRELRRRPVRGARDLDGSLEAPLLGARPARAEALRELCRQLLVHWFTGGRALLPVVSAQSGEGRTRV